MFVICRKKNLPLTRSRVGQPSATNAARRLLWRLLVQFYSVVVSQPHRTGASRSSGRTLTLRMKSGLTILSVPSLATICSHGRSVNTNKGTPQRKQQLPFLHAPLKQAGCGAQHSTSVDRESQDSWGREFSVGAGHKAAGLASTPTESLSSSCTIMGMWFGFALLQPNRMSRH